MQALAGFFGFTTLAGVIWNSVAYLAFILIIIGVFSDRYRNILMTFGAAVLALYAAIFLHNPLFAALQTLIVVSGFLQLAKVSKRTAMATMVIFTAVAYLFLALNGSIANIWALLGSLGLLGIAFGLVALPQHNGFLLMATGGVLLIVYAFTVAAWVFFLLNVFFTVANIRVWRKR